MVVVMATIVIISPGMFKRTVVAMSTTRLLALVHIITVGPVTLIIIMIMMITKTMMKIMMVTMTRMMVLVHIITTGPVTLLMIMTRFPFSKLWPNLQFLLATEIREFFSYLFSPESLGCNDKCSWRFRSCMMHLRGTREAPSKSQTLRIIRMMTLMVMMRI